MNDNLKSTLGQLQRIRREVNFNHTETVFKQIEENIRQAEEAVLRADKVMKAYRQAQALRAVANNKPIPLPRAEALTGALQEEGFLTPEARLTNRGWGLIHEADRIYHKRPETRQALLKYTTGIPLTPAEKSCLRWLDFDPYLLACLSSTHPIL